MYVVCVELGCLCDKLCGLGVPIGLLCYLEYGCSKYLTVCSNLALYEYFMWSFLCVALCGIGLCGCCMGVERSGDTCCGEGWWIISVRVFVVLGGVWQGVFNLL